MATTPATKQSETDHDHDPVKPAPGADAKTGSGVTQVQTLLARGKPSPAEIVKVIDAHRSEHDAIFALLQKTYGNTYVQQVVAQMNHLRASVKNKEVVAGDPASKDGGFFDASAEAKGASWRSNSGDFTGTANKDGLDSTYKLDADDSLHGTVKQNKGDGAAAAGTRAEVDWLHDGKNEGAVFGNYKDGKNYQAGASRDFDLGSGTLAAGVERSNADGTATDGAFGSYRSNDKKLSADGNLGVSGGQVAGGLSGTYKPNANDTYTGSYRHDAAGDTAAASATHKFDGGGQMSATGNLHHDAAGTTGSIAGAYDRNGINVNANAKRTADTSSFHLGASDKITPNFSTSATYDYSKKDGAATGQHSFDLGEKYRSGNVVEGLDVTGGAGTRDYIGATGSVEGKLANNLYGGAYGGFQVESGHQTTANIGASLTFTPSEKTALTLAGVVDQNGTIETRLQLDIFKSKIDGIQGLSDQKKNAMVSLFVSYTQQGGTNHMLDQRFGASEYNTGGPAGSGAVMAGIRIKF